MPKLFWAILAVGRGGFRYLRAVLAAAAGAVFRLKQSPGSGIGAKPGQEIAVDAGMVSRPVSDARMDSGAVEAGFLGRMVAWLVSSAYPMFHAGTALLNTHISLSPDAGMRGEAKSETVLESGIRTDPATPGRLRSIRQNNLEAAPKMAASVPMFGLTERDTTLSVRSCAGIPGRITGCLEAGRALSAEPESGLAVSAGGTGRMDFRIGARMMTWSFPEWMQINTLYISQVYETKRDGETLILH